MQKVDKDLALKIYTKASATPKVIAAFAERREYDKILTYSKQVMKHLFYQTLQNHENSGNIGLLNECYTFVLLHS